MSELSEREIERLLNAAGESRREQAGSPRMPPATREILRTEVVRRYGAGSARRTRAWRWWRGFLPKLALLTLLAAVAWWVFERDATEQDLTLAHRAAAPVAPTRAPDTVESVAVARRGNDLLTTSAPVPTAEPSPALDPADRLAGGQAMALAEGSVVDAEFFKANREEMYMGTAVAGRQRGLGHAKDSLTATSTLFASGDARVSDAIVRMNLGASTELEVPLSRRFTVLNEGQSLQVIDADGSTYVGTLEPLALPVSAAKREPALVEGRGAQGQGSATGVTGGGTDLVLLNYKVVMSGTNRTLRQALRFEGDLALTEQQMELGRNVFSNQISPVAAPRLDSTGRVGGEGTPGRLQGRAVVDDGRLLEVDAVPAR